MNTTPHAQEPWPELVDVAIESLAQGGAGVGHWEGRTVFVQGALPGETVRARILEQRPSWARARQEALLSAPSELRIKPPCPLYERCGGCDWQYLAEWAQAPAKNQILQDQLAHMGRIADPKLLPPAAGAPWGYRATATFHVQGTVMGFYGHGSKRIVDVPACPISDPRLNDALALVRAALPLEGLRNVTLRISTTTGAVHAHLDGRPNRQWQPWARQLLKGGGITGISSVSGNGWRDLAGDPYLLETVGDVALRISPTSFFQANVPQARAVLAALPEALGLSPEATLLDAFCGVGTFVLPLARQVAHAWGIESHGPAIRDAQASAQAAKIANVTLLMGTVEALLPQLEAAISHVVLDPPRRGCEPEALSALLRAKPRRIAYLSCHPGTLARDVRALTEGGYALRSARTYDFFPQTAHVESLVVLEAPMP